MPRLVSGLLLVELLRPPSGALCEHDQIFPVSVLRKDRARQKGFPTYLRSMVPDSFRTTKTVFLEVVKIQSMLARCGAKYLEEVTMKTRFRRESVDIRTHDDGNSTSALRCPRNSARRLECRDLCAIGGFEVQVPALEGLS